MKPVFVITLTSLFSATFARPTTFSQGQTLSPQQEDVIGAIQGWTVQLKAIRDFLDTQPSSLQIQAEARRTESALITEKFHFDVLAGLPVAQGLINDEFIADSLFGDAVRDALKYIIDNVDDEDEVERQQNIVIFERCCKVNRFVPGLWIKAVEAVEIVGLVDLVFPEVKACEAFSCPDI
ncbi:hypothetical protein CC78DRAFT_589722 [Lojkania enalia]|uniref:Extracellular globin n=1 Tax=Lojkania enalia TaxID=147567 RepID=A0A9P4K1Y0_9PLEO|nr:hypothetical protein CC78DRAFT_589722 [Didymosphaeria enalia]